MKSKPSRLRLFDFDGTLVFTPGPDTLIEGVPALERYDTWLAANGLPKRRFLGWWGRPETLQPPIFGEYDGDGRFLVPGDLLNEEVASLARDYFEDQDCLSVLMTGRHMKMKHPKTGEHLSKVILDGYGITFDRYYYVAGGQITINFKLNALTSILDEFPTLRSVEVWEDREPHTSKFWDFLRWYSKRGSTRLEDFRVHQVYPPQSLLGQGETE